jgi:fructokinase
MRSEIYQIGIDLGGTKIETILFAPDGSILHRERIPTPRGGAAESEYSAIRDAVQVLIEQTMARIPGRQNCTIGVGIPGTIDPHTQLVQNANTTCLCGKPFQKDLQNLLGRPIGMENDANCFTLAEARQGAAKGYGLVFGMILGTGCGGGICIDGRIHRGRHQIAGEWGHFSVDPKGDKCFCGNPGCIETKISGTGVAAALFKAHGRRLTLEQITAGYRRREFECAQIFTQFLDDFGRGVGGLISLLDPDAIVLGGGASNIDELYTLGLERIRHYAFHAHVQTPILRNQLGDSAGVYGAAWIGGL